MSTGNYDTGKTITNTEHTFWDSISIRHYTNLDEIRINN